MHVQHDVSRAHYEKFGHDTHTISLVTLQIIKEYIFNIEWQSTLITVIASFWKK